MPALGRPPSSFIAVFVEDGTAKVWRVEINSGAMDELARFSSEGLTRAAIFELTRIFVKGRAPDRVIEDAIETNGSAPMPRPRKDQAALTVRSKRPHIGKAYEGLTYAQRRQARQMARQRDLREALERHPEGITGVELGKELGRPNPTATGVELGVLKRSGLARHDEANGAWFPVTATG